MPRAPLFASPLRGPGLNHFHGLGFDLRGSGTPWVDNCGHGSHVAGTILGDPVSSSDRFTGVAPDLGWGPTGRVVNVKILDGCGTFNVDMATLLDIFHSEHADGSGNVTPRPHVVNHSWGSVLPGPYFGTEAEARDLGWSVYLYNQQHVFAAGNLGSGGQSTTPPTSPRPCTWR